MQGWINKLLGPRVSSASDKELAAWGRALNWAAAAVARNAREKEVTEYTSLAKAVSARLSAEVPGYTTFGPGAVAVQEVENAPLRDPLLILKESIQAVFAVPSPVDRGLEVSFNKRIKRLSEPCSCLGYRKYRSNLRFWVKKKQSDNASPLIDDSLPSAAENQGPFRLLLADLRYMSERGGALIENQFKWSLL